MRNLASTSLWPAHQCLRRMLQVHWHQFVPNTTIHSHCQIDTIPQTDPTFEWDISNGLVILCAGNQMNSSMPPSTQPHSRVGRNNVLVSWKPGSAQWSKMSSDPMFSPLRSVLLELRMAGPDIDRSFKSTCLSGVYMRCREFSWRSRLSRPMVNADSTTLSLVIIVLENLPLRTDC